MVITLLNLSNHVITVSRLPSSPRWRSRKRQLTGAEELGSIYPSQAQNVQVNGPWNNHLLFESLDQTYSQPISNASKGCLINPTSVAVRVILSFDTSWQNLDVSTDCPWRVYCSRVCWTGFLSVLVLYSPLSPVVKGSSSSFNTAETINELISV